MSWNQHMSEQKSVWSSPNTLNPTGYYKSNTDKPGAHVSVYDPNSRMTSTSRGDAYAQKLHEQQMSNLTSGFGNMSVRRGGKYRKLKSRKLKSRKMKSRKLKSRKLKSRKMKY
jgi:hypothetical protein